MNKATKPAAVGGGVVGRTLDEFQATYDKSYIVPRKIKEAIGKLKTGWMYEPEFARLAEVSLPDINAFRDEFEAHVVAVKSDGGRHGKRIWAGTPELAQQLRDML